MQNSGLEGYLDNLVDMWHEDLEDTRPIHVYLGMTKEQYEVYATNPSEYFRSIYEKENNQQD